MVTSRLLSLEERRTIFLHQGLVTQDTLFRNEVVLDRLLIHLSKSQVADRHELMTELENHGCIDVIPV